MSRTYKTPKGTDLPIILLKGKEYLEVKYRIVWFREERADWCIETEMLSVTETSAYAKATIKDQDGRIKATSHKFENKQGFADFIEKAETGSIGRALALIGFGTQFCADELDEGARLADSPTEPQQKAKPPEQKPFTKPAPAAQPWNQGAKDPGDYVCTFGTKFKNKAVKDCDMYELDGYCDWLIKQAELQGKSIGGEVREFLEHAEAYLKSREPVGAT